MTEANYKGQDIKLVLDMYTLRMFGRSVGADTPGQAMGKLQEVYTQGAEVTFEMYDVVAALFYNMALSGNRKQEKPLQFTQEDCYDVLMDDKAVAAMLVEINSFFPAPDEVKKKKVAEAVE